jgi:PAS domain S-box-containing protein
MPIRTVLFILPTVGSILWSFGFIIMVNQRLNAENLEEKQKLQMVFNMSPDAKSITRLSDGALVDVNVGFLAMTGYAREEILGSSILDTAIWDHAADLQSFRAELNERGIVESREVPFRRKDGSPFTGMISGSIIAIHEQPHLISVIYDITDRKLAEQKVRNLLAEQELILKEVHHRIKNNMATIHSLLSLQAASLKDPVSITALEDAGSRIQSMMMLYETLYKSSNFMDV